MSEACDGRVGSALHSAEEECSGLNATPPAVAVLGART